MRPRLRYHPYQYRRYQYYVLVLVYYPLNVNVTVDEGEKQDYPKGPEKHLGQMNRYDRLP